MAETDTPTGTGKPVERFRPTGGQATGVLGLLIAGVAVGYVLWRVHTLTGLRVGLAMAVFGTLVWVTQLRPRATAYADSLHLRNMLRDTIVPLRLIDAVTVRQMLYVWVDDKRYGCVGIGRSVRTLVDHKRPTARVLGFGRLNDLADKVQIPHPEHTAMPYATFVETRIDDLVKLARKDPAPPKTPTVRKVWAWPEVAVLVLCTSAFLLSLLL